MTDLRSRIAALSATLSPRSRRESANLAELEKLLVRSKLDDDSAGPAGSAHIHRALSIDRALRNEPSLAAEHEQRIGRLLARQPADQEPAFRVFRREAAVAAPMVDLAAPAWGRGSAAVHSLGPFHGDDGRLFWFDFFPIVRLVPLYLAGDSRPALLFFERRFVGLPPALGATHRLGKSSFWLRADLLAAGAPAGSYVGLRIEGGSLKFSVAPIDVGGKLTMPGGTLCTVDLRLSPSQPPPAAAGNAGEDAAKAALTTPDALAFEMRSALPGRVKLTTVTRAEWKLFDQAIRFERETGTSPSYEPLLASIVVPFRPDQRTLRVAACRSPFARVEGKAKVQRSGWTLPIAQIDVDNPTEAAGDGGLAVQTDEGLTLSWDGLRDGPIHLRAPWVALASGLVVLTDPHASNRYAHQRLRLWKDADSKFRSELALAYTDEFAVTWASASNGNELVLAQTDIEAKLDRPVDVTGTPFAIHTRKSLLSLQYSNTSRHAFVYDDNILVDSLDPKAHWPLTAGQLLSLAIRNALFTISPVNSLLLFSELQDEETVKQGSLFLGMGLFGLLPSLPDPYAANVRWLREAKPGRERVARPSMLLVSNVGWAHAAPAVPEEPDAVATRFEFAPLGTQEETLAFWTEAARQQALLQTPDRGAVQAPDRGEVLVSVAGRGSNQRDWDRQFAAFENEQFALVDVSTNADQMGVSFAWFDSRRTERALAVEAAPTATDSQSPFPLQVRGLDLSAQSRFVRAFLLPQVSWEPLLNLTPPTAGLADPPAGWNLYPNDGGPTRLVSDSPTPVPIEPLPVAEFLVEDFGVRPKGITAGLFTLPFGIRAFARFSRQNPFSAALDPANLSLFRPEYEGGALKGALQIRADAPPHPAKSPTFEGATLQLDNVLTQSGAPTGAGTLGESVATIFNKQFFYDAPTPVKPSGVPLSRIDFCGYGASAFSHWEDPSAVIAATSKAYFDIYRGRTAQEVIQVRSLLYPWGVHVVRTITLTRASDGYVFRYDTGWQAESDGVYDFRYKVFDDTYNALDRGNPYEFHPGLVHGVFKVRNIKETSAVAKFQRVWNKTTADTYLDSEGKEHPVTAAMPVGVTLQPVYFDADVEIEDVISGAVGGRVPSTGMLGYVQLAPRGEPIPPALFAELLNTQFGSLGGPVAAVIDVGKSGQQMRINRVDVNASTDGAKPIFVSAARGAVILPKDGSWSVVQHDHGNGEVSPLDPQATVPLIRRGKLSDVTKTTDTTAADLKRVANPIDLVRPPTPQTRNFGLLQSTNTQKALFRLPSFQEGVKELKSAPPDFADAYRLLNSKGIFPNVQDALPLNLGAFKTKIIAEGYKLLDEANPAKVFEQVLPNGPLYLINEEFLKLYIEYANNDKKGNNVGPGALRYGLDSAAANLADKWVSKLNDISMVVDLGSLKRMLMIKGKFDAEKGAVPSFKEPKLVFCDELQPVVDILQILDQLQGGDYAGAFQKGLEIAMSNSADSWNYAFHARKEIPVVKFPPGIAYDNPTNPFKLEAHMAVGVYFGESLSMDSAPKQLIPSAGAFLEFGGSLSVMCVSLAAATVYAVGSVDLRTAADIKTGPSLHMKFGFGAEISVGLPVIGTVSILYMVGVEVDVSTGSLTVAAFLLFRGRAEILGGIVTVQIQIEAQGIYKRIGDKTELAAQVTFGLDISIFLVINLHFSKSWQESRQIA